MRIAYRPSILLASRLVLMAGIAASMAACSDSTRLSQPFFSEDTTGSLPPIPPEPVYGEGLNRVATAPVSNAGRGAITSAPLAAAPGTTISDGPISTRAPQPIPQNTYAAAPRPQAVEPAARPAPRLTPAPKLASASGRTHTVRQGDTLYSISRDYDVSVSELTQSNSLSSPDRIRVGQTLTIPGQARLAAKPAPVKVASSGQFANDAAPIAVVPTTRPASNAADSGMPQPKPVRVATLTAPRPMVPEAPKVQTAPQAQKTAMVTPAKPAAPQSPPTTTVLPEPDGLAAGKFRWPVRGRIVSEFGSRPGGVQNDGINIAVPEGTSVKAAENGVVAYVGNELKGYGNLVLIRHDEDWVTAYAHNSEVLVQRGDKVQRGQIIAKAGKTGNVNQPQLHFEIRKGSRPVDPVPQLAGI